MRVLLSILLATGCAWGRQSLTVELPGGTAVDFVWVEAQTFTAGLTREQMDSLGGLLGEPFLADARAAAETDVTVAAGFWLARTELTRAQWHALSGPAPWDDDDAEGGNLPASRLRRADAEGWIGRLNAAAGDSLFRLPSEAEWELAARAGTTSLWSFGDELADLGEHAWYRGLSAPQPVATKVPNPWGLYDMQGNVEEWTSGRWTGDSLYATCAGITLGGSFAAGDGQGYLSTLPFLRQPRDCTAGEDLGEDLDGVGLRLVYRGPAPTTAGDSWGAVKVRRGS